MFGQSLFQDAPKVRWWTLGLLLGGALLGDVLFHWAPAMQTPLALALILGIGLQHGSVDHVLHAHMHGDPEGPLRQSFVLPYVGAIGLSWVAFETVPALMLGLFLLVSAYHFGMSHLRVDAMRRPTGKPDTLSALVLGTVLLAPLITRPDALDVMARFGWDLSLAPSKQLLPLQLASGAAIVLAAVLHRAWRNGLLALTGAVLAWFVHDLLLAFALYFALGHAREAFFEEFQERQSLTREFLTFYRKSVPLTLVFALMAGIVLWSVHSEWLNERAALSFLLAGTLPHIAVLEGWGTARMR